nr:hypothetical protein [Deltaproteobacteria bacterium]
MADARHRLFRNHCGELVDEPTDEPTGTVVDGLTRWLDDVQQRGGLHEGHRRRLSPRTVVAYRYSAALLTAVVGGVPWPALDESHMLEAFDELPRGSWHSVGTAWQAALRWLGLGEAMPSRGYWANKPQKLTWDPNDYDRAFAALSEGYQRATRLRRGGSLSVSACALLVAVLGLRVGEAV